MQLSVIVPVYNEEENIPLLHESIKKELSDHDSGWEVIYVDDGSSDRSLEKLYEISRNDKDLVTVIELRRNFGQTAAIAAGIDHSSGEIVVLLDADLQNDPADIPTMLEKIEEGYDVVSGWRKSRKDKLFTRRVPSKIANWLISIVTGVKLHDYGCTLKAYRREVLTNFRLYGEMHRFIPAYAHSVGAKILELPVQHHPRKFGKTKYGLNRTLKVLLDLFTVKFLLSYSRKPIYLFGGTGMALILISGIGLLFLLIRKFVQDIAVLTSPLFTVSIMLIILGFQSILMGFIAELLARTYHESQNKPTYVIKSISPREKE